MKNINTWSAIYLGIISTLIPSGYGNINTYKEKSLDLSPSKDGIKPLPTWNERSHNPLEIGTLLLSGASLRGQPLYYNLPHQPIQDPIVSNVLRRTGKLQDGSALALKSDEISMNITTTNNTSNTSNHSKPSQETFSAVSHQTPVSKPSIQDKASVPRPSLQETVSILRPLLEETDSIARPNYLSLPRSQPLHRSPIPRVHLYPSRETAHNRFTDQRKSNLKTVNNNYGQFQPFKDSQPNLKTINHNYGQFQSSGKESQLSSNHNYGQYQSSKDRRQSLSSTSNNDPSGHQYQFHTASQRHQYDNQHHSLSPYNDTRHQNNFQRPVKSEVFAQTPINNWDLQSTYNQNNQNSPKLQTNQQLQNIPSLGYSRISNNADLSSNRIDGLHYNQVPGYSRIYSNSDISNNNRDVFQNNQRTRNPLKSGTTHKGFSFENYQRKTRSYPSTKNLAKYSEGYKLQEFPIWGGKQSFGSPVRRNDIVQAKKIKIPSFMDVIEGGAAAAMTAVLFNVGASFISSHTGLALRRRRDTEMVSDEQTFVVEEIVKLYAAVEGREECRQRAWCQLGKIAGNYGGPSLAILAKQLLAPQIPDWVEQFDQVVNGSVSSCRNWTCGQHVQLDEVR